MKRDLLYENILEAIRDKISNKGILTSTLVDLLDLEKEAVYRRLRGEVAFSFSELAIVSSTLGISLDNMVGGRFTNSRPFQLRLVDYGDLDNIDYKMLEHYIYIHNLGKYDKRSRVMDCSGILPQSLYLSYKNISRFFLFKWIYQNKEFNKKLRFQDVYPTERLEKIQEKSVAAAKRINQTIYVWDPLIFYYLANDIRYFISIHLLSEEDLLLLKIDLLQFLDDMEVLAFKGQFDDTGNRCVEVKHLRVSLIRTFTLNAVVSLDHQIYERISSWLEAIVRSSTMISVSGGRQRIQFFEKQREVINAL